MPPHRPSNTLVHSVRFSTATLLASSSASRSSFLLSSRGTNGAGKRVLLCKKTPAVKSWDEKYRAAILSRRIDRSIAADLCAGINGRANTGAHTGQSEVQWHEVLNRIEQFHKSISPLLSLLLLSSPAAAAAQPMITRLPGGLHM